MKIEVDVEQFARDIKAGKVDGALELISDNRSYNSEIIVPDELDAIRLLGKVIGKVALV